MKYNPNQIIGTCDKCGKIVLEPKASHTMNYGKNMVCNECEAKWSKIYDKSNLSEILRTLGKEKHSIEWKKLFKEFLSNNPSRRDCK